MSMGLERIAKRRDPSGGMSPLSMDAIQYSPLRLHDSTAPEAIFATQRTDVRRYLESHTKTNRPSHADISAALVLPLWNVERCLAALEGREMVTTYAPDKRLHTKERTIAFLKTVGEATAKDIAAAIGTTVGTVRWMVVKEKETFLGRAGDRAMYKGNIYLWRLK